MQTASKSRRLRLPLALLGIATQMRVTSLSKIAERASSVVRKLPEFAASVIASFRPGPRTRNRPISVSAVLRGSGSVPLTVCTARVKHAAESRPTYPRPNTLTLIFNLYRLRRLRVLAARREIQEVREPRGLGYGIFL